MQREKIWCPYTDAEIDEASTSPEHIIPLSLGGSNSFIVPVQREFNAKVGSTIDGALANDLMVKGRRRDLDARGHSKSPAFPVLRKSRMSGDGRPVQVSFPPDGFKVWDSRENRVMREEEIAGQQFESSFTIDRHTRLKFVAKAALSAGHFIYGDLFRRHVRHNELRATMNLNASTPREAFTGFETRGYDEFSPVADGDAQQVVFDRFLCKTVKGSCVMALPGPRNLGFVVGVLGQWTGTLNVPAVTDAFPSLDDHDLGHVIALVDGKMERLSYRAFVGRARPIQDSAAVDAQDTSA